MVSKAEKEEKQDMLKAVSKVNSLWEFLAFLTVTKNNLFWFILFTVSFCINVGLLAKYTGLFGIIFKYIMSLFGGK